MAQTVKNLPAVGETGFDPWVERSPGEENGNLLQYSCLENPMDREASRVTESDMTEQLSTHTDAIHSMYYVMLWASQVGPC